MNRILAAFLIIFFALYLVPGVSGGEDIKYGDKNGQLLCPVLKSPIDKNVYTDYKGKRIYFCCPGCIADFNKNPEKYMKILKDVKLDDTPANKDKK